MEEVFIILNLTFRCEYPGHTSSEHDTCSFEERRCLVEELGWEPFSHWFVERDPGPLAEGEVGHNSFRTWWLVAGCGGVPLWKLRAREAQQQPLLEQNIEEVEQPQNEQPQAEQTHEEQEQEDQVHKQSENICTTCSKKFNSKKAKNDHIRNVHSTKLPCKLCPKEFSMKSNLQRHIYTVHMKAPAQHKCEFCIKCFHNNQNLRNHQEICKNNSKNKPKSKPKKTKQYKTGYCGICKVTFSRIAKLKKHNEKQHTLKNRNGDFMLVDRVLSKKSVNIVKKNICYLCSVLRSFYSKFTLKRHIKTVHGGQEDRINTTGGFIRITPEEKEKLTNRRIFCNLCENKFKCVQDMRHHLKVKHKVTGYHHCKDCNKYFKDKNSLAKHKLTVHCSKQHSCSKCIKSFKTKQAMQNHLKVHRQEIKADRRKTCKELSRKQAKIRAKQDLEEITKIIQRNGTTGKAYLWKNLLKNNPEALENEGITENPLSEEDIIMMIQDNNMSDRAMHKIISSMSKKWGRSNVITKNISKKLIERKKLLDPFFTQLYLDKNSEFAFKDKKGRKISRYVTYCHDIPALLAYKQLVEGDQEDNEGEGINLVGIDDGKELLKVVFNWSRLGKDDQKNKLKGPKRSLVLAGVAKVPESHHNMHILIQLTKLNEIKFTLSQDLKLTNIVIGITTHSSKYPCAYGECSQDDDGKWSKGRNRTPKNIRENQEKWLQDSRSKKGVRSKLKKYMNCEFLPLVGDCDENVPILFLIPPPPLHTILLGRATKNLMYLFKI